MEDTSEILSFAQALAGDDADTGFTVTFSTSGNCSINIYYTKDSATADETNVTAAVSRNGDTGAADSTGDGQVNFLIVPADGYAVSSVTATEGTYKNIKGPSDTGVENLYRVTKITADTTVTITLTGGGESGEAGNTCTVSGGSADISLNVSEKDVLPGTYVLMVGFYGDGGQCLSVDTASVSLSAEGTAEAAGMQCPSSFSECTAFLLEDSSFRPVCAKTTLTIR